MLSVPLLCALLTAIPASTDSGVGGISFRNTADRTMMLYWVSHDGSYKFQGQLCGNGCQTGFQTYAGHQFIWAEMGPGGREPYEDEIVEVGREVIKESQMVYAFSDHTTKPEIQAALDEELGFMEDYYNKNGFHWTGTTYPRPPPTLPMITANKIGEEVLVPITDPSARQWHCKLKPPKAPANVRDDPRNDEYVNACLGSDDQTPDESVTYRGEVEDGILVEVVSVEPRVFVVKRFLSNFEADYIVSQARPQLRQSTTGHGVNAREDTTRKSKSAWLTRGHSAIMDSIYRRIALVTKLPQELLKEDKNAENLNVLHYPQGGEYTPHYDWGPNGKVASRFISGLLYLSTPLKGGGTSFPKSKTNAYVPAVKGGFAFFYDLLADGNGDVLSLHAGTPVAKGHKWVAPLWIWEPSLDGTPHEFGDLGPGADDAKRRSTKEL